MSGVGLVFFFVMWIAPVLGAAGLYEVREAFRQRGQVDLSTEELRPGR